MLHLQHICLKAPRNFHGLTRGVVQLLQKHIASESSPERFCGTKLLKFQTGKSAPAVFQQPCRAHGGGISAVEQGGAGRGMPVEGVLRPGPCQAAAPNHTFLCLAVRTQCDPARNWALDGAAGATTTPWAQFLSEFFAISLQNI